MVCWKRAILFPQFCDWHSIVSQVKYVERGARGEQRGRLSQGRQWHPYSESYQLQGTTVCAVAFLTSHTSPPRCGAIKALSSSHHFIAFYTDTFSRAYFSVGQSLLSFLGLFLSCIWSRILSLAFTGRCGLEGVHLLTLADDLKNVFYVFFKS